VDSWRVMDVSEEATALIFVLENGDGRLVAF
jgi:hypothetical protein